MYSVKTPNVKTVFRDSSKETKNINIHNTNNTNNTTMSFEIYCKYDTASGYMIVTAYKKPETYEVIQMHDGMSSHRVKIEKVFMDYYTPEELVIKKEQ
jgi:hypothetical protein